jgi:hypothetical protein
MSSWALEDHSGMGKVDFGLSRYGVSIDKLDTHIYFVGRTNAYVAENKGRLPASA